MHFLKPNDFCQPFENWIGPDIDGAVPSVSFRFSCRYLLVQNTDSPDSACSQDNFDIMQLCLFFYSTSIRGLKEFQLLERPHQVTFQAHYLLVKQCLKSIYGPLGPRYTF